MKVIVKCMTKTRLKREQRGLSLIRYQVRLVEFHLKSKPNIMQASRSHTPSRLSGNGIVKNSYAAKCQSILFENNKTASTLLQ